MDWLSIPRLWLMTHLDTGKQCKSIGLRCQLLEKLTPLNVELPSIGGGKLDINNSYHWEQWPRSDACSIDIMKAGESRDDLLDTIAWACGYSSFTAMFGIDSWCKEAIGILQKVRTE